MRDPLDDAPYDPAPGQPPNSGHRASEDPSQLDPAEFDLVQHVPRQQLVGIEALSICQVLRPAG